MVEPRLAEVDGRFDKLLVHGVRGSFLGACRFGEPFRFQQQGGDPRYVGRCGGGPEEGVGEAAGAGYRYAVDGDDFRLRPGLTSREEYLRRPVVAEGLKVVVSWIAGSNRADGNHAIDSGVADDASGWRPVLRERATAGEQLQALRGARGVLVDVDVHAPCPEEWIGEARGHDFIGRVVAILYSGADDAEPVLNVELGGL